MSNFSELIKSCEQNFEFYSPQLRAIYDLKTDSSDSIGCIIKGTSKNSALTYLRENAYFEA